MKLKKRFLIAALLIAGVLLSSCQVQPNAFDSSLSSTEEESESSGNGSGELPEPDPTPEPERFNNFASRENATFDGINGKTVTVDTFIRHPNEATGNPNVGQGIMLYQCIRYKEAHPEEEVYITLTSFHLSVVAAVCLDRESEEFGLMKSLYDVEYDDAGYVRLAYLLVYAAKIGIHVTAIGHIDGSAVEAAPGVVKSDYSFIDYFNGHLDDDALIEGKKVRDFMTARRTYWTSYGDKAASDMMHVKSCTVSNYLDKDGNAGGPGVWVGSTNIDGITYQGYNGNNGVQTGVIISNHEEIRRTIYNYTRLMADYCEQEEIAEFRALIRDMNKTQIDLILAGRGDEIPVDQRIVYLGGENDEVFEFYFTPIGGSVGTWDVVYNPYSKYIAKLLPATSGGESITFAWNNVKYLMNFEYAKTLVNILNNAFIQSGNLENKLYLRLPLLDAGLFSALVEGENIGVKMVNINMNVDYHSKDAQLSYVENGVRYYVSLINTLNFHQGAMSYQTNTVLVIKETEKTGNNVYVALGKDLTEGCISEGDRILPR